MMLIESLVRIYEPHNDKSSLIFCSYFHYRKFEALKCFNSQHASIGLTWSETHNTSFLATGFVLCPRACRYLAKLVNKIAILKHCLS